MHVARNTWLIGLLLAAVGGGCDGGRGSTGFDISENAAIQMVLETQECVTRGLAICPADQSPVPTAGTTATPTPTVPPATPPGPTWTPAPAPSPRIDTGVANGASIVCTRAVVDGPCTLTFLFAGIGFPDGASFHVASRLLEPATGWELAPPPWPSVSDPSLLAAEVTAPVPLGALAAEAQFAVLVFLSEPDVIPARFDELAQSGANYGFVTPEFALEIVTLEPQPTPTATAPTPPVPTATPTPTVVAVGPIITYFGVARADSLALAPTAFDGAGRPIYVRPFGHGLLLIVEAQPGMSGRQVGRSAYDAAGGLPDLQMILSNPIGDGSQRICDATLADVGGVPAVSPLEFSTAPAVVDAINDLGCRVDDGFGNPLGRDGGEACTLDRDGEYRFVDAASTVQFCLPIAGAWAFPGGDTIVAARLRDTAGLVGAAREIVVRIANVEPTPTPSGPPLPSTTSTPIAPTETPIMPTEPPIVPTATPTATQTETPSPADDHPEITHFGLARADSAPLVSTTVDQQGRDVYERLLGQGMSLIIEGKPGTGHRPLGDAAFREGGLPDLQVIVSRPLGDGSAAVCDLQPPMIGGVPATMPLAFSDDPAVTAAINDLGCRVSDGTGQPLARGMTGDACTISDTGITGFGFVKQDSTVQYCLPIARAWSFPGGETVVAARLRDVDGRLSAAREIVVRVAQPPGPPPPCPDDERLLTIGRPQSMLQVSYAGAVDVSTDPWHEGPLPLCIGAEAPDGTRSLHLRNDVTIGLPLVDGSVLCAHLRAEGSAGRVDCRGGGAHDVVVGQDSHGADDASAPVLVSGLGTDAGAGAASLTTALGLRLLPIGTAVDRCQALIFASPGDPVTLTTAMATARIDNPIQGGEVSIAAHGGNFDCGRITESDSPGTFVLPFPAVDTVVGDVAGVLILAD